MVFLFLTLVQSFAGQKFPAQKFLLTPLSWREQKLGRSASPGSGPFRFSREIPHMQ